MAERWCDAPEPLIQLNLGYNIQPEYNSVSETDNRITILLPLLNVSSLVSWIKPNGIQTNSDIRTPIITSSLLKLLPILIKLFYLCRGEHRFEIGKLQS